MNTDNTNELDRDETLANLKLYYDDLEFWPVNEYNDDDYEEMAEYYGENSD